MRFLAVLLVSLTAGGTAAQTRVNLRVLDVATDKPALVDGRIVVLEEETNRFVTSVLVVRGVACVHLLQGSYVADLFLDGHNQEQESFQVGAEEVTVDVYEPADGLLITGVARAHAGERIELLIEREGAEFRGAKWSRLAVEVFCDLDGRWAIGLPPPSREEPGSDDRQTWLRVRTRPLGGNEMRPSSGVSFCWRSVRTGQTWRLGAQAVGVRPRSGVTLDTSEWSAVGGRSGQMEILPSSRRASDYRWRFGGRGNRVVLVDWPTKEQIGDAVVILGDRRYGWRGRFSDRSVWQLPTYIAVDGVEMIPRVSLWPSGEIHLRFRPRGGPRDVTFDFTSERERIERHFGQVDGVTLEMCTWRQVLVRGGDGDARSTVLLCDEDGDQYEALQRFVHRLGPRTWRVAVPPWWDPDRCKVNIESTREMIPISKLPPYRRPGLEVDLRRLAGLPFRTVKLELEVLVRPAEAPWSAARRRAVPVVRDGGVRERFLLPTGLFEVHLRLTNPTHGGNVRVPLGHVYLLPNERRVLDLTAEHLKALEEADAKLR